MAETATKIDHDYIRARLTETMEAQGLTLHGVMRKIGGISTSTLSLYRSGTYTGDNDKIGKRIEAFLDSVEQSIGVQSLDFGETRFCQTETSARIRAMLIQAQHAPCSVVIAGVPGIGKTRTAEEYARTTNNVWITTMDPSVVSPFQVLLKLARSVGEPFGDTKTLQYRIGDRLQDSAGLLIIDEVQHCAAKALEMIRFLHDEYKIGIAYMGNHGLYAKTYAASKQDGFAQFFRRIRKRQLFNAPSARDLELVMDSVGVTDGDQRKFLTTIGQKMWGLSGIFNTLQEAHIAAHGQGADVTIQHLRQAWAQLNPQGS